MTLAPRAYLVHSLMPILRFHSLIFAQKKKEKRKRDLCSHIYPDDSMLALRTQSTKTSLLEASPLSMSSTSPKSMLLPYPLLVDHIEIMEILHDECDGCLVTLPKPLSPQSNRLRT
jgi:hypothetical protein